MPDVRKTLRERHLRVHVVWFFELAEDACEQIKHQRAADDAAERRDRDIAGAVRARMRA